MAAELSGGQQQRVSIARALLLSPELVLANRPFNMFNAIVIIAIVVSLLGVINTLAMSV